MLNSSFYRHKTYLIVCNIYTNIWMYIYQSDFRGWPSFTALILLFCFHSPNPHLCTFPLVFPPELPGFPTSIQTLPRIPPTWTTFYPPTDVIWRWDYVTRLSFFIRPWVFVFPFLSTFSILSYLLFIIYN